MCGVCGDVLHFYTFLLQDILDELFKYFKI